MQFININNKNIITILVFCAIFIIGINVYKDYGITLDDEVYQKNGNLYYEYVRNFFSDKDISILKNSEIYTYPVLFEVTVAFIADIFNITESKKIFELSHFINFVIFFLSLICFYKLINKRFYSYKFAILGVLLLIISPRIFAESFYNSRDIFFLSLIIFNMYTAFNFILKHNFSNSLLFALSSALIIDAKVIGIIFPLIIFFFLFLKSIDNKKYFRNNFKFFIYIVFFTFIFIILFWPYLWDSPIKNILFAFRDLISSHNSNVVLNLYLGKLVFSDNVPWHYRPVWFLITTPVIISFLFFIGIFFVSIRLIKRLVKLDRFINTDAWKSKNEMLDIYFLLIIILSLIITIKFNSSQFNGWRHLYYIYPSIIIISLNGLYRINLLLKSSNLKKIVLILIAFNILYLVYWNIKYHPFQNVYFNFISKKYVENNFDLDYWGVSNINSLNYIIKTSTNFPQKVATISFSSLRPSVLMLEEQDKNKIDVVFEYNKANFLITNYMKRFRENFIIDENMYKKYYEIVVNDIPINTVYKKID